MTDNERLAKRAQECVDALNTDRRFGFTGDTDFPLRDRFAMQFMDRWLGAFVEVNRCTDPEEIDVIVRKAWSDAYGYADLGMKAREPKKEKDDD